MRGLIDGIVTQRETLIGHAEQVRTAIGNVHVDLSHEIGAVSDMVSEQVQEAARKITESLEEKGAHITRALQQSGDSMIAALGDRGGDMLERLEAVGETTSRAIAKATERMNTHLSFKTSNINEEFAEITANVQNLMGGKLDQIADDFSAKTVAIIDQDVGSLALHHRSADGDLSKPSESPLGPRRRGQQHAQGALATRQYSISACAAAMW